MQILINISFPNYISIPYTFIIIVCFCLGVVNITKGKDGSFSEEVSNNILGMLSVFISSSLAFWFFQYIIFYFQHDGLDIMASKLQFQSEIGILFEHLDEAIISKGINGVSFCN